jgi:hypothetical protein
MKSRFKLKPLPVVNAAGRPLMPLDQIVKKWQGVFDDDFWDEVLKARKPTIKPLTARARK